jgi:hypothetical protein
MRPESRRAWPRKAVWATAAAVGARNPTVISRSAFRCSAAPLPRTSQKRIPTATELSK